MFKILSTKILKELTTPTKVEGDDLISEDKIFA